MHTGTNRDKRIEVRRMCKRAREHVRDPDVIPVLREAMNSLVEAMELMLDSLEQTYGLEPTRGKDR